MVKELSKGTGRIGAPCLLAINSIKCLVKKEEDAMAQVDPRRRRRIKVR